MSVAENLRAAKKLIKTSNKWCQGDFTKYDKICASQAIGAILKRMWWQSSPEYKYLQRVMGQTVSSYNDSHTHAEVLVKFDEAIKLAEEESV